jgi:hypothetical protein
MRTLQKETLEKTFRKKIPLTLGEAYKTLRKKAFRIPLRNKGTPNRTIR